MTATKTSHDHPFHAARSSQTSAARPRRSPVPVGRVRARLDVIRVGLIGCGGRGTGAAAILRRRDGVELVAMGDLVPDRLAQCRAELAKLRRRTPRSPRSSR